MGNRATAVQLTFFEGPRTIEYKVKVDSRLNWREIAKIVLPRFPELQPGEHIGRKEIERRLRELKKTRFPVENYGKMSQSEMFRYLIHDIRPYVYRMAGQYCPEVVNGIIYRNKRSSKEVSLFR